MVTDYETEIFAENTASKNTLKFCRVCGFRVRVWGSYINSRSFGYGYGSVAELPEVPGIVAPAFRTHRSSGRVQNMMYPYPGYCGSGLTELTGVPGTGIKVLQNFQKGRVRIWKCYKTSRTSGYCGTGVQNFQKFRAGINMLYPYPGSLWHRRTELPKVLGTGMSPTKGISQVRCRVIPEVNTPGMVLYVPYRHDENRKFGYGYECRTELTDVPGTGSVVQNAQKSRVRIIPG